MPKQREDEHLSPADRLSAGDVVADYGGRTYTYRAATVRERLPRGEKTAS